ncbi:MAG TPA: NUDIX domain-containing protein [Rubricoccaceae bacterium]|jgi:8-oxo-dGTP pyrophosphatase MutT (NUDIX family)
MLLYLPTFVTGRPVVPAEGWAAPGEPFQLRSSFAAASADSVAPDGQLGRVLVLDSDALSLTRAEPPAASVIPRAAVLNVDPDDDFWPPLTVDAGGGYVVRPAREPGPDRLDVLMIFRRGVWDLPKGKLDPGESFERAAVREVSEEVGVPLESLRVVADLGATVHGYIWPRKEAFAVKTTHWYAMTTTAEAFEPEDGEGIEAVAWVPWTEAGRRVGFESLRRHHAGVDPDTIRLDEPDGKVAVGEGPGGG